jgi:4-hydroxy-tetrahydrodipicolinate reductase
MFKIVVTGAKGRMGGRIIEIARDAGDLDIVGAIDKDDALSDVIAKADAIIDFSTAVASAENASIAAQHGTPIVIGTTGLTDEQWALVQKAAKRVAIIFAPNMSVGVNVMCHIVKAAAQALGPAYAVDIVETHHVHKIDRPSGTAKRLIDMVAATHPGQILELVDEDPWKRDAGDARISCRSIRRDEVIGDHAARFSGPGEWIEISHSALSRDIFALGALKAARWIVGKPAGLYGMEDVIGLNQDSGTR